MPNSQALQFFYGSVPLIMVIIGVYYREQLLLKSLIERLSKVEDGLKDVRESISRIRERLASMESKLGLSYVEK